MPTKAPMHTPFHIREYTRVVRKLPECYGMLPNYRLCMIRSQELCDPSALGSQLDCGTGF
jgi:hypothetical protein